MKPYLLLMAVFYCQWINATCMLSKIPIDSRTNSSHTIIDGQVIAQHSFWNVERSSIFTVSTVQVNSRLKGVAPTVIEIITPGGELDGKLLVVEPNAELQVGSKGIFFLKDNTIALNYTSIFKQYEIYSLAQGFIEEDQLTGKYRDPFDEYANRTVVYSLIGRTTGMNYRLGSVTSSSNSSASTSISAFTPTTISAGTQSILTISGTGFGTRTGSATIQFRDANSTNSTTYASIPDSSYIVSWTNTEIKVIVPGASAFRQGGSGTGLVNVVTSAGTVIPSPTAVNISFNQFEYKKKRVSLINQNGLGGYTFTFNTNFNSNAGAKDVFTRALDQWKCKTGVNAIISTTTSSTSCNNQMDNINIVSFADPSCPLPAGALGTTYSTYSLCANSPIIPDGMDMIFSPGANFYMATGTPASNQYDFESVVLHELGHAFGEGHSSNGNEIMYPSIANGFTKRILNPATDITSVKDVVLRSASETNTCGYLKHTGSLPCSNFVASFIADKYAGCAPLTINFSDKTTGDPTSWRWDIDNNGTTEYTVQNPSHTFTKPGYYTIKMVAANANASDSVIKIAHIYVTLPISLNMQATQNISCNGGSNGTVTAIATGGDGNYTYLWNNNQTSSVIANVSAGTYSVSVKDGNKCLSTGTTNITQPDPISVNVNPQTNSSATLNIAGGTIPYTYSLNNSSTSRLESSGSQVLTNLTAGNYTIEVKDKNNCGKNTSFSMNSVTPVNEAESKIDNLEVYPNPATNNININLSLKEEKNVTVELIDLSGRTVFQDEYTNIKEKQTSVDLSSFANGTYILRFGFPEGSTFKKIIVSR